MQDVGQANVLALHSLRHVKELEMVHSYDFRDGHPEWQEWPMAWSRLTALTSLSCTLSHEQEHYPPRVLNRMTSLQKIKIDLDDPEVYPDVVDEEYDGDEELAYQAEILERVVNNTRGLTRLTSLLIDRHECIGMRSDEI